MATLNLPLRINTKTVGVIINEDLVVNLLEEVLSDLNRFSAAKIYKDPSLYDLAHYYCSTGAFARFLKRNECLVQVKET